MIELPLWRASVDHGEVDFDAANDAATEQASNVEYPWDQPLVEVSKVRERLLERAYAAGGERAREYRLGIRYDEEGFEHRDAHEELPDGLCSADMMVAYAIVKAALDAAFPDKETE